LTDKKVGDYISLGKYEQDDKENNGAEDIEWRILVMLKYYIIEEK